MNIQLDPHVRAVFEDIVAHTPDIGPTPRADIDAAPSIYRRRWLAVAAASILVVGLGALIAIQGASSDTPDVAPATNGTANSVAATTPEPSTPSSSEPTSSVSPSAGVRAARLAFGDQVMLGAAHELADAGFVVDAQVSRAFVNGVDSIEMLSAQGRLGDVVVVHLSTNGPISDSDMARMMKALQDVPRVLLVTGNAPRGYTADNNALIYDTAAAYPNVSVLDWAGLSESCPGDCLYSDQIHLRPAGQAYYAALITAAIDDG